MKKIFILFVFSIVIFQVQAQKLARVYFNAAGGVETLSFQTDEGVLINVTSDGTISKYGVDLYQGYRENISNQLQDYVGRVENFTDNDNIALRGKVKSIGRTQITYYASYDNEAQIGKIKSIGNLSFDYYLLSEDEAFRGKLKSAGSTTFSYYSSYDNEIFRGRFKSIGNSTITYYSSMEDAGLKGKIKSIGSSQYTYYPAQYFRTELRGRLKSGNLIQQEGPVKYYLKY